MYFISSLNADPSRTLQQNIMKAKLGGLNSYLQTSTSREKREARDDRDETSSRRSRRAAQANNRSKYEELDYDTPINNFHRREVDIDNEQEHFHHAKQLARGHKAAHDSPQMKRVNSRDVLPTSGSSRNLNSRQPVKQNPLRAQYDERQDDKQRFKKDIEFSESENSHHFRHETKQCIEALSFRVRNCLEGLNDVITEFRNNLRRMVEEEYNKLETLVMSIVETTFTSELENVRNLCKIEEKKMSKSVAEVRDDMDQMYNRLQKMKEGMEGPQWKRVTGDFFKEDIEGQVQHILQHTEKLQLGKVVHMHFDQKREEEFKNCLMNLLQVHLTSRGEEEGLV